MNLSKKVKQVVILLGVTALVASGCSPADASYPTTEEIELIRGETFCRPVTVEEAYIEVETYHYARDVNAYTIYSNEGVVGIALGVDENDHPNASNIGFSESHLRELVFDYNLRSGEEATICTMPSPFLDGVLYDLEQVVNRVEFQDGTIYDAQNK